MQHALSRRNPESAMAFDLKQSLGTGTYCRLIGRTFFSVWFLEDRPHPPHSHKMSPSLGARHKLIERTFSSALWMEDRSHPMRSYVTSLSMAGGENLLDVAHTL